MRKRKRIKQRTQNADEYNKTDPGGISKANFTLYDSGPVTSLQPNRIWAAILYEHALSNFELPLLCWLIMI